jgi:hypothetical protein
MFDVISFLEKMGANANLRHASAVEVERELHEAGISASLSTAILTHNVGELHELMHQGPLYCFQTAGDQDEEAEKRKREAAGEEEEKDGNRKGDKAKNAHRLPVEA